MNNLIHIYVKPYLLHKNDYIHIIHNWKYTNYMASALLNLQRKYRELQEDNRQLHATIDILKQKLQMNQVLNDTDKETAEAWEKWNQEYSNIFEDAFNEVTSNTIKITAQSKGLALLNKPISQIKKICFPDLVNVFVYHKLTDEEMFALWYKISKVKFDCNKKREWQHGLRDKVYNIIRSREQNKTAANSSVPLSRTRENKNNQQSYQMKARILDLQQQFKPNK